MMNFSKPLVTPEELYCLLGWPLPDAQNEVAHEPNDSFDSPLVLGMTPTRPSQPVFAHAA